MSKKNTELKDLTDAMINENKSTNQQSKYQTSFFYVCVNAKTDYDIE